MNILINSKYYLLLEINENATDEEIKKAYRRKAHELHPDKNKDTDSTQKFQELNHAYQILTNTKFSTNNYWAQFEEYEKEQEELYEEINLNKFKINIDYLTCTCRDWKKNRNNFMESDPRRLCRHIIALFGEKNISPTNYFIGSKESVNSELLNQNIDFKKLIYKIFIPNEFLTYSNRIYYNYESKTGFFIFNDSVIFGEYVNIFYENNSHEFAFRFGSVNIYLKNNFEVVLNFDYAGDSTSRFECKDNFYKICSLEALKEIEVFVQKNTDWNEHFCNFKKEYNLIQENKKGFSIDRTMISSSFNYYGLEYKDFKKIKGEYLNQYDKLTNLLKLYDSNLTGLNANKTLLKLGIIHKETNLNRGEYIIKDTYNKYGINYMKSRFGNIQKTVPYWYKVSYFDVDKYRILESNETKNIPFTEVLFKIENFNDVYKLIIENTKPANKNANEESSIDKKLEREFWLKNVECPYCNGKNLHKKDKRERQNYQVQRYMCMDCNKIFQKIIEENY